MSMASQLGSCADLTCVATGYATRPAETVPQRSGVGWWVRVCMSARERGAAQARATVERNGDGQVTDWPADVFTLAVPLVHDLGKRGVGNGIAAAVQDVGVPAGEQLLGRWWCSRRRHDASFPWPRCAVMWKARPGAVGADKPPVPP